jgi:hypothetical protein
MFSREFTSFSQGIFGQVAVRAEVDLVMDFYRGAFARLPDGVGFSFWVQRLRAAQCAGAASVGAEAEAISSRFFNSPEYAARNRTNAQFVGDLYNAFLRRGGDPVGFRHWLDLLGSGPYSREFVRTQFLQSQEFRSRVIAVERQGCVS